jgi:hypothetical protein
MRFDGWNTIEGRHLVFVYASVILIQGGYFLYVASQWLKLHDPGKPATDLNAKKTTRPV